MKIKSKFQHALRSVRRPKIRRAYKDHLFRLVFQNKADLLDLYNAVNDTDYSDPNDLTITTLQDVIYLGMKNDISFVIGCYLNLYEHQSTLNPNMPLRGFFYIADVLRGFIDENGLDLYSSGRLTIPTPRYIVFYNGTTDQPDRTELSLSDSYLDPETGKKTLECTALMLNINYGHNRKIMNKCKRLADYAYFVQKVRDYLGQGLPLDQAADRAVAECIEQDILSDILRRHRAEVMNLLLTVYDKKLHDRTLRQEGREEGREEGRKEGREKGLQEGLKEGRKEGIRALIDTCREFGLSRADTAARVSEKFQLSKDETREYITLYWENDIFSQPSYRR